MAAALVDAGTLEASVRRLLDEVKDPCSVAQNIPMGLDEMGVVKAVRISPTGVVEVELRLTSPVCEMIGYMRQEAIAKIGALPGVTEVLVTHDAGLDWDHDLIAPAAQARRQARLATLRGLRVVIEPLARATP